MLEKITPLLNPNTPLFPREKTMGASQLDSQY